MTETVVGIFPDWATAHTAVDRLREAGFPADEVSLIGPGEDTTGKAPLDDGASETTGAVAGAAAGGALGAMGGFLLGLTAVFLPVLGPLVVAGPIAGGIAGAAVGAGAGGLLGTLVAAGVPHEEAGQYHEALERGSLVVAVHSLGRSAEARQILVAAGAEELRKEYTEDEIEMSTPEDQETSATTAHADADEIPAAYMTPALVAAEADLANHSSTQPAAPLAGDTRPGAADSVHDVEQPPHNAYPADRGSGMVSDLPMTGQSLPGSKIEEGSRQSTASSGGGGGAGAPYRSSHDAPNSSPTDLRGVNPPPPPAPHPSGSVVSSNEAGETATPGMRDGYGVPGKGYPDAEEEGASPAAGTNRAST